MPASRALQPSELLVVMALQPVTSRFPSRPGKPGNIDGPEHKYLVRFRISGTVANLNIDFSSILPCERCIRFVF
jgi:hypothetical protein